jgi:hypothetical protein
VPIRVGFPGATRFRDRDAQIEALVAEHCTKLLNVRLSQSLRDPECYYARESNAITRESLEKGLAIWPTSPHLSSAVAFGHRHRQGR